MKKLLTDLTIMLMVLILSAGCIAGGAALAETPGPRKILTAADADEWIRTFLGDHPEAIDGAWEMTAQMKMAALMSGGTKGLARSLASLGTVQSVGTPYEGTIQGYQVFYVPCVFSAAPVDLILVLENGAVAGLQTGPYTGGREEVADTDAFDSVELALPVPAMNGELPGTLTLPKGDGPFPAVVLVHGSGPNDRDETMVNQKPFRDLAEGLAELGVAVYRYDKRTLVYGAVMAADRSITLEQETIEDAAAAVQLLAGQEKIDPERIFVLGHSLGGNAVPAIDRALRGQKAQARGYVMMAASPRPLDELMREQYETLYALLPEITPEQQAQKDALFAELDKLRDLDGMADSDTVAGIYTPYWKWLAAYDVLEAAEEMTKPVLLMQGEEDYQVLAEKDFRLFEEALGGKDNWTLVRYPGLTHGFTPGQKAEGADAYARPEKVDPGVIRDIADFVKK